MLVISGYIKDGYSHKPPVSSVFDGYSHKDLRNISENHLSEKSIFPHTFSAYDLTSAFYYSENGAGCPKALENPPTVINDWKGGYLEETHLHEIYPKSQQVR